MAKEFSTNDAKSLINKHQSLLSSLREASKLSNSLKESIKKAADALVVHEVLKVLRGVSVEELNRDKRKIRTKALLDHNITTMADLWGLSVYNIAAIRGISQDTAYTIKRIVNDFVDKTRKETKIKISADNKGKEPSNLVKAISIYKNTLPYIYRCDDILEENSEQIQEAIADLRPGTSGFKWFFTSKTKKAQATEA